MEIMTMGKVVVSARIENLQDAYDVEKGSCGLTNSARWRSPTLWWTPAPRCYRFRGVSLRSWGLLAGGHERPGPQPALSPSAFLGAFA